MTRLFLIGLFLVVSLPSTSQETGQEKRWQEAIRLLQARLDDTRARAARETTRLREEVTRLGTALSRAEKRNQLLFLRDVRAAEELARIPQIHLSPTERIVLSRALLLLGDPRGPRRLHELSTDPRLGPMARQFLLEHLRLDPRKLGLSAALRCWRRNSLD